MNLSEMRKDIILFKDETLKTIREMGKQLFEGIKQKSFELDSKISEIESKLSKYKETNKRMYDIILEQKVYIEKIKNLTEFKSKAEMRLLSFDIKLSNFFSELVNFKSHYDKIIVENLNIPGIIGVSCKYNTIADYIADNINKTKLYHSEQEKMKNEVHVLKKNCENLEKSLNGTVDVAVSTSKLYADARNNELKNIIAKNIENFNIILTDTKNDIDQSVLKKDDVKTLIKYEIKNNQKEIMHILEEHKKQKDKENKDKDNKEKSKSDKIANTNEIKKEIKEIKKNFKDLQTNIENQVKNALKMIKSQGNSKMNDISNNLLLKSSDSKNKENTLYNNDSLGQENSNNNIGESYNKTLQNNNTRYHHDKSRKEKGKEKEIFNTEGNKNEEATNFKKKANSKHYKIKSIEKALGLKSSKETNKLKGVLLNPIYLDTNKNEHNIIEAESPISKNKNSTNKEFSKPQKNSRNENRYRTFSEAKYSFKKKYFQDGNNILLNNEETKKESKIYLKTKENEKEKQEKKKYVIHSINSVNLKNAKEPLNNPINNNENDKDDTFSSEDKKFFRRNIKEENNDNDNNNIAIKLMKNKKQMINDFNINYVKQYYPTLNLYKNYYNKKMIENKEKERFKEKTKIPKKISPAFGRTAYTEFVKSNNNFNSKIHNGKVNININLIDNNFKNLVEERKYFYTLQNGKIRYRSFTKDKNRKKQKNKEENLKNLSV